MEKNYTDITKRISGDLKKLRNDIPETMQAFSALAKAATRDGALDKKTKELIALAIGIATRCDGCIGFHTEALVRLGATRQEVEETLGMAVYMGGGPSLMYAADAISAFEQFQQQINVAAFGENSLPIAIMRSPSARAWTIACAAARRTEAT
jgi:AhpD family alkylhydroperoxidase